MEYIKDIHIGKIIFTRWKEMAIPMERTCNFLRHTENEIEQMFENKTLDSGVLLRWSKLLEYDFFRLYTHHLILYAPQSSSLPLKSNPERKNIKTALPQFRKNVYTKEVIDYLLKLIDKKEKTPAEIISEYRIPKTTLYKWINKYKKTEKR